MTVQRKLRRLLQDMLRRRAWFHTSTQRRVTTAEQTTTIFAPCTIPNLGHGRIDHSISGIPPAAVCVLRVSGPHALSVLQTLCMVSDRATSSVQPAEFAPNKLYVRNMYHPRTKSLIDVNALVTHFRAPKSFTGEDVVELHVHGSRAVVQHAIAALMSFGPHVQPALPGEFTKRAFYNDKIDLLELEGLSDVLSAETQAQKDAALRVITRGESLIASWRASMIASMAAVEAVIDFGEDDLGDVAEAALEEVAGRVRDLAAEIASQLAAVPNEELVQQGVHVVLMGRPNVGKSSLLNLLLRNDTAAIVSPLPGTTRDVLERVVDIGGHKFVVVDGAGLRELGGRDGVDAVDALNAGDAVEAEGMGRIVRRAREAHIVIVMDAWDACDKVSAEGSRRNGSHPVRMDGRIEREVAELLEAGKEVIWVRNKVDLLDEKSAHGGVRLSPRDTAGESDDKPLHISCQTGAGIDALLERLQTLAARKTGLLSTEAADGDLGRVSDRAVLPVMYKERHVRHLRCTVDALGRFLQITSGQEHRRDSDNKTSGVGLELAAEELRLALAELGHVTGAIDLEHVLDEMMTKFCIGK
jgi:tRNA modification GTPase